MFLRNVFREIVGKTISGVVVKRGESPKEQVYLVFDDDTHFEVFNRDGCVSTRNHVDDGDVNTVRGFCHPDCHQIIFDAFLSDDGESDSGETDQVSMSDFQSDFDAYLKRFDPEMHEELRVEDTLNSIIMDTAKQAIRNWTTLVRQGMDPRQAKDQALREMNRCAHRIESKRRSSSSSREGC